MDAMTINGPSVGMINFTEPNSRPINFTAYDPTQNFDIPDQWGQNPYATGSMNNYGILQNDYGFEKLPPGVSFDILIPDAFSHENEAGLQLVSLRPFLFIQWEVERAVELFAMPEQPPFPLVLPQMGEDRASYQSRLDEAYDSEIRSTVEEMILSVINQANGQGIIFTGDSVWDLTPFEFVDGQLVINPLFGLPWNLPFNFYSRGDSMRLIQLCNHAYNFLSTAYGENQKVNLFPPYVNFWDKLWNGAKKFFPGLVIARNAFRGLVALNIFQLADEMASFDNPDKLKTTWESLGGEWSALVNSINQGTSESTDHLGEPGTAAGLIAAATPIIITIIQVLGIDIDEDLQNQIQNSVNGECKKYAESFGAFVAAYQLQNIPAAALNEQFNAQFPGMPPDCFDLDDVKEIVRQNLPSGFSDDETENESGQGGTVPIDPGSIPPADETESLLSQKTLLLLGSVIGIAILLK